MLFFKNKEKNKKPIQTENIEIISSINKYYDKVVCINLLNRKDKKKHMENQFQKLNIKVDFFTAVTYGFENIITELITKNNKGFFNYNVCKHEFGCTMSHYTVIKTAYEEGINKLFVFEDDCIFIKNFNEKFEEYYNNLPDNTNLCMLYSYMDKYNPKNENINRYWKKMFRSWSAIAYGMDRTAMKSYIDYMDKYLCIADMPTYKMPETLNCYMSYPPLIIPNYDLGSDIRNNNNKKETILLTNINLYDYDKY
ncbi:MAG: glycosyltransferase family 25 protein [Clostridia bacterium]